MRGDKIFDNPCIAYDNSPHSLMLLDIIDHMKHSIPKVNIIHVNNPNKSYMMDKDKGQSIYKLLKQRYPDKQNPGISVELKDNLEKNTNLVILESYVAKGSSILFVGFAGSKGSKPRSCDLSSRIRQFVYQSRIHLAIVKQVASQTGKVLFLLDGSDTSFEGLQNTLAFCKRFSKELSILHTFNADLKKYSKHIKLQLKAVEEDRKDIKWETLFEQKPLLEAIRQRESCYDWIVMNKNGYRGSINKQRFVGSNTSKVIEDVNCNLIIFA